MDDLIFGYTWEQIQAAQQGKALQCVVPLAAMAAKDDICTKRDLDLFIEHGEKGLKEKKLFGVIDRLERAGILS